MGLVLCLVVTVVLNPEAGLSGACRTDICEFTVATGKMPAGHSTTVPTNGQK